MSFFEPNIEIKLLDLPTKELWLERLKGAPMNLVATRRQAKWFGIKYVFAKNGFLYMVVDEDNATDTFKKLVGREPVSDDLHRLLCDDAGKFGHMMCGWCDTCEALMSECGCALKVVDRWQRER